MAGRFPYYSFTPHGIIVPPAGTHLPSPHHLAHSPAATITAKRDSDEVQFVSANPLKKRKIDRHDAPTTHPVLPAVAAPKPCHETGMADQPGRILSAASCKQPPVQPAPESDPLRGCSAPALGKSDMFENLWTAPSTGPRSSVALSPKQLPQDISPAMLLVERQTSFRNPDLPATAAACSQQDTVLPPSSPAVMTTVPKDTTAPSADTASVAPKEAFSVRPHEEHQGAGLGSAALDKPQAPLETPAPALLTGLRKVSLSANDPSARPDRPGPNLSPSQDQTSSVVNGQQHHGTLVSPLVASNDPANTPTNLSGQAPQPANHSGTPVLPDAHHAGDGGTIACTDASKPSGKGPCVHCLQKRLRQAAMLSGAASLAPVAPNPGAQYGLNAQPQHFAGRFPQDWPQQANMSPFPGQLFSPLGQVLPQHMAYPQGYQQGPQPHQGGTTTPQAPVAPMSTTTGPSFYHPSWYLQGPGPHHAKQPPVRQPQMQFNGKHIIVDIAETCVEVFPFEEIAQRHNQPPKKVREIFEAIIQMPLMRCPTDKRRAGKKATARVKEYTQARRELQAQMGGREGGGQGSQAGSGQKQPSAWEVAQFMGPSDAQVPGHLAFSGPLW